jgi:hypothetical protein
LYGDVSGLVTGSLPDANLLSAHVSGVRGDPLGVAVHGGAAGAAVEFTGKEEEFI